ncbi:MAG: hypothetical protein ACKVK0_18510, partial [Pirellulales bacterium]
VDRGSRAITSRTTHNVAGTLATISVTGLDLRLDRRPWLRGHSSWAWGPVPGSSQRLPLPDV